MVFFFILLTLSRYIVISLNICIQFQRTTRGILCDVFSIVRFDIDQFQNQPAVVEYYFLAVS